MSDLADSTVTQLLEIYRRRQATPIEALESCLGRIDRLDSVIDAVLTLLVDRARKQATESTRRWSIGEARPLEGVPYGLKDIILTAGIRTTGGSMLYADYVPAESATVAQRLEAAGGVLVAKLQTFELAAGSNATTSNPWDLERWPCGSSSGPAVAVAARELPLSVGTDTSGSIIGPAAFCGIVGLKPTFGRIPRSGIMPLSWTLDHAGPLTRSVVDAALALTVLAGHDPKDPTSAMAPVDDYLKKISAGLDGVRIGVPTDWFFDVCDPEVEAATRTAIKLLATNGATVIDIPLPSTHLVDLHAMELMIVDAERASLHDGNFHRLAEYGGEFQRLLVRSQFVSAVDYLKALRARHLVQLDFQRAFNDVDALITPSQVCTAPRQDHLVARLGNQERSLFEVASRPWAVMNMAGIPTLTVPVGFDQLGLPIGMQVVARPHNEAMCFRIGSAYQQLTDFHRAMPPIVLADAEGQTGRRTDFLPPLLLKPVVTATKDRLA